MDRVPVGSFTAADAAWSGGFNSAASAGLFVGVSKFEDDRLYEVPYAVDDAVDLAHLFALELGTVAPERAVLLLAGEPKKAGSVKRLAELLTRGARRASARQSDIYRYLGETVANVGSLGFAFVSVASHGVSDAGGDFLVATDSRADRKLRTGVAVTELFEEVARAGRGLVLLDACREQVLRARGEAAGSAVMGKSFAEAIACARGLVVLSGATLGGFTYDDPKRENGAFTAAVLDGLRGGAAPGLGGWITVRTLADYVQEQMIAWVRRERPGDTERSRGIGKRIEDVSAESLPLAPHPSVIRERYRERRQSSLDRVDSLKGEVLSGMHWDQVRELLPKEKPNAEAEKLLSLIEGLDGSELAQRGLKDYLRERAARAVTAPHPKPKAQRPIEQLPRPARPTFSPSPAQKDRVRVQPGVGEPRGNWQGKDLARGAFTALGIIALAVLVAVVGSGGTVTVQGLGLISWVIFGTLTGWLSRLGMPSKDPGGCLVNPLIGVVGAVVGGWIATLLGFGGISGFDLRSFIIAVLGSLTVLFVYYKIKG